MKVPAAIAVLALGASALAGCSSNGSTATATSGPAQEVSFGGPPPYPGRVGFAR